MWALEREADQRPAISRCDARSVAHPSADAEPWMAAPRSPAAAGASVAMAKMRTACSQTIAGAGENRGHLQRLLDRLRFLGRENGSSLTDGRSADLAGAGIVLEAPPVRIFAIATLAPAGAGLRGGRHPGLSVQPTVGQRFEHRSG